MKNRSPRIDREKKTISAMVRLWCRKTHNTRKGICEQCRSIEAYAFERLDRCPFGEDKTTCLKCHVHCYRPAMKEIVKEIMRYAGPRMLVRHPYLAIKHMIDEWQDRCGKTCKEKKPGKSHHQE